MTQVLTLVHTQCHEGRCLLGHKILPARTTLGMWFFRLGEIFDRLYILVLTGLLGNAYDTLMRTDWI